MPKTFDLYLCGSGTSPPVLLQHLPANLDAEVPADGARLGVGRVGLPEHHSACLHHVQPLPDLQGQKAKMIKKKKLSQKSAKQQFLQKKKSRRTRSHRKPHTEHSQSICLFQHWGSCSRPSPLYHPVPTWQTEWPS